MFYLTILKTQYFSKYKSCKNEKQPILYYCEKSDEFGINELKQFPNLYFDNVDLNYTFVLTYKDLFIEMNGKYFFLVTENEDESWLIGYSLLKKYQFVFNQDSRTVGFYNPDIPIEKESDSDTDINSDDISTDEEGKNKDNEKVKNDTNTEPGNQGKNDNIKKTGLSIEIVILIAVLSGVVFLVIGIVVGKFISKKLKEKKRANELDENYDYNTPQETIIN